MKNSFVCPEFCNSLASLILLVCLKVMDLSPPIGYGSVWIKVIYHESRTENNRTNEVKCCNKKHSNEKKMKDKGGNRKLWHCTVHRLSRPVKKEAK